MVVQCCVCKRRRQGNRWVDHKQNPEPDAKTVVSHGYCPECAAKAFREISDYMVDSGLALPPLESSTTSKKGKRMFPAA